MLKYDDAQKEQPSWHDSQQAVVAGGLAALILIGVLIYAVIRVSDSSGDPPPLPNVVPATSSVTATSGLKTPSSTSYSVPSAQTSEPAPAPVPGQPAGTPADDPPAQESTPTTIYNPYATPSSSSSAGHV